MQPAGAAGQRADEAGAVYAKAAELFAIMSSAIRLQIISRLCGGEMTVSQLLAQIETTQPNMSQHLAVLHRTGVLARRRDGAAIYYRIGDERAAAICRAVCTDIAIGQGGA